MHTEIVSLIAMLNEAASILRRHSLINWASWLERDARLIERSDFDGIEHLLSAYGGMGSINDVGLGEPDPENVGLLRPHHDDSRLQELIAEIHSLATQLSREEQVR